MSRPMQEALRAESDRVTAHLEFGRLSGDVDRAIQAIRGGDAVEAHLEAYARGAAAMRDTYGFESALERFNLAAPSSGAMRAGESPLEVARRLAAEIDARRGTGTVPSGASGQADTNDAVDRAAAAMAARRGRQLTREDDR